jgi:hypothetical protein
MGSGSVLDEDAVARSLSELTAGWTAAAGVDSAALIAARSALAASIVAGKSTRDLRVAFDTATFAVPPPALGTELRAIAHQVKAAPAAAVLAVIRSPLAAGPVNPSGVPPWARGAQVLDSLGPFEDTTGALHWVDLIPITSSEPLAFSGAAPCAVVPVRSIAIEGGGLPHETPGPLTELALGTGSVWILASLLGAGFPAGEFTGFRILGGTLSSTEALAAEASGYAVPIGATLTLTMSLAPPAAATAASVVGPDAAAATFSPPPEVTVVIDASTAAFTAVGASQAGAYGTALTLSWTGQSPTAAATPPAVLVPVTPSTDSFEFTDVASTVLRPSEAAPITEAAWALPLTATTVAALPEAAGPGACLLTLGAGAAVAADVAGDPAVSEMIVEIGAGSLLIVAESAGPPTATSFTLWPEASPSTLDATVQFDTSAGSMFVFLASVGGELLLVQGGVVAHLDRPLTTAGSRVPFASRSATAIVLHLPQSTLVGITARSPDVGDAGVSLALENALIEAQAPALFAVIGRLADGGFEAATVGLAFALEWLLPTLPDPYASSFDPIDVRRQAGSRVEGLLLTRTRWVAPHPPVMACSLLTADASSPAPTLSAAAGTTASAASLGSQATIDTQAAPDELTAESVREPTIPVLTTLALLDLSTNVDLFGVAVAPAVSALALQDGGRATDTTRGADGDGELAAPLFGVEGMNLALNGGIVATFALPQVSWEPIESTTTPADPAGPTGPIFSPDTDGLPLIVAAPDVQRLVAFAPQPVLSSTIELVAAGAPFAAVFSLPFGLNSLIIQPNQAPEGDGDQSGFIAEGGTFERLSPAFALSAADELTGSVALTVTPAQIDEAGADPRFPGGTATFGAYGASVLNDSVASIFDGEFDVFATPRPPDSGVPLARIDFSGYGASIFSEWIDPSQSDQPGIIKAQFEVNRGRTLLEVIVARSIIYPYGIRVVRTITMQRQNAGWIKRTDSGWQAATPGQFQFELIPATQFHLGPLTGVFNVRNIREQGPEVSTNVTGAITYQQVVFDADLGIASGLEVRSGAFVKSVAHVSLPQTLAASQGVLGWVQISDAVDPAARDLAALIDGHGPFTPAVSFSAEAGGFGGGTGTVLRCSAFEVAVASTGGDSANPSFAVALHGAPLIPRGGGWSMGVRRFSQGSPTALAEDLPVPLVRNNDSADLWHLAAAADVLSLTAPRSYYSLMHATGTNTVLFEAPRIPATAAATSGSGVPGLQFPSLPAPLPGGVANPGTPNLGDLASILNATGLFPDLGAALSILDGELPQLQTTPQGFRYTKSHQFGTSADPLQTTLIDLSVLELTLIYGNPFGDPTGSSDPIPAVLTYTVDSSQSPSWTLSVTPLAFQVALPAFGGALLTITGGFYGDEHTKPGLTNLQVHYGSALSIISQVMSDLQALASFLPGGVGANLDIAVSDGQVTVGDSFTIADLPLGLGQLTDISLDLGLDVSLSPLSVEFLVGLGAPENPFNWLVTPLAGTGLINLGVQNGGPALIVQGGIGLGIAIDLGIASGSASITLSAELDINPPGVMIIVTLTGQASVDVLDGLASASITLSAGLGLGLNPAVPLPQVASVLPPEVTIPSVDITMLATCSVGIHLSICWVVSVSWDGSWQFEQSVHTPAITVSV